MAKDGEEETRTLIVRASGRQIFSSFHFLLLLLLLVLPLARCQVFVEHQPAWRRDDLDQESSCYFQPFYKQLTCKCPLGQVQPKYLKPLKPDLGELFAYFEDGILHQGGWA